MTSVRPYVRMWYPTAAHTWLSAGVTDYIPPVDPPVGTGKQVKVSRSRMRASFVDPTPPPDRSSLVAGVDQPDDTNTGVFTGVARTSQNTAITYGAVNTAASPQQIVNMDFTEKVSVTGKYIDFHNCFFRGPNGPIPSPAFQVTNSGAFQIRCFDCTFEQQNPIWDSPGAKGWQFEFYRCRFKGVTDGIQHIGQGTNYTGQLSNITVQQCYFDDFAYMSPDPGAAGGLGDNASHLDCVQIRGGRNIKIWGNSLQSFLNPSITQGGLLPVDLTTGTHVTGNKYKTVGFAATQATSCVMLSPVLGSFQNLQIIDNWMDGASYMVNFNAATAIEAGGAVGIRIRGNRVGYNSRTGSTNFIIGPTALQAQVDFGGNVRPDTGAAANFWKAG